jgi:hypothetical protein
MPERLTRWLRYDRSAYSFTRWGPAVVYAARVVRRVRILNSDVIVDFAMEA